MHMLGFLATVFICVSTGTAREGDVHFKVSHLVIVDNITQEFSLDCRPRSSLESGGNEGLMLDIYRTDASGDVVKVARQRYNTEVMDDDRTSAEGHLKMDDDKSSFLKVTIQDPTYTEEGIYTCRYVYMDPDNEVRNLIISANVSVKDIPPPEVLPEVQAEEEVGCSCDAIWEEINALKAAMAEPRETLPAAPAVVQVIESQEAPDTCRVSFTAKFPGERTYPIHSEAVAPFHEVISNKGGAFKADKGAFAAPCDGQYFFSVTLRSETELDSGYVDGVILVDGVEVARSSVFVDSPINNYESGTNGVVVTLKTGQEVKVQVKTTSFGRLRGSSYSLFSGFYLSP